MKKTLLVLAMAISLVSISFAQKANKAIESKMKNLQKCKEAVDNPSKASSPQTWIDYANALIDVDNAYTAPLFQGMSMAFTPGLVGRPVGPKEEVTTSQTTYTKYPFATFDLYNDASNNVQFWIKYEDKALYKNALPECFEALKKAKDLSASTFVGNGKGAVSANNLKTCYETEAFARYYLDQYEQAAEFFVKAADAAELTGVIDTNDYFYAGLLYNSAEKLDLALPYLLKLKDLGCDKEGAVLCLIADVYTQLNKPDESLKILDEAAEKYPTNKDILLKTINAYVKAGKDTKMIVDAVHKAQVADPTNPSLYLVEGSLYMEINDNQKAIESFKKATEIDPKSYQAYYNLAIMCIQDGDAIKKEAENLPLSDTKGYDEKMKLVVEKQNEAITYLEKVYEIKPDDVDTISLLRQLYYPRRDKHMEERYDFFDDLYKKIGQ